MKQTVLPLRPDSQTSLFPWIMSVLLFLLVLIGLCFKLYNLFNAQTLSEHAPSVTVEIPFSMAQKAGIENIALSALSKAQGVSKVKVVPMSHLKKTLERFLGETKVYTPYPVLLHVWSEVPSHHLVPQLKSSLASLNILPHFLVHETTTRHLRLWNTVVNSIIGVGFCVVVFCLLLFFIFALSTYLRIHVPILELLILIGAPKRYIQKQFQHHVKRLLWKSFSYTLPLCLLGFLMTLFVLDCWNLSALLFARDFFFFALFFVPLMGFGIMCIALGVTHLRVGHLLEKFKTKTTQVF